MDVSCSSGNNNRRIMSFMAALLLLSLFGLGLYTSTSFFPDVSLHYQYFDDSGGSTSDTLQNGDAPSGTLHHLDISMDERIVRVLNQTSANGDDDSSMLEWKHFQHIKIRDGKTLPLTTFGGDNINSTLINQIATFHQHFDMTRNVPRIQDFIHETPSRAQRTFPIPPTAVTDDADQASRQETTNDESKKKNERLNIVLFYADDWTMKVLGKLNPMVQTPNIDEMADNGVLFSHNCVTTSICWISRATLATGVYAAVHQHKKIGSTTMFNETLQWPETLYPLLKANGYYTGLVGKWHAPTPGPFMKYTFDVFNSYYGKHWFKRNGKDRHVTDLNGEDALAFLQTRPKDRNFALTVSFFATHARDYHDPPYAPMPETMNLYVDDTLPRPKTATERHWEDLPWFFDTHNEGRRRWKNRFDTEANYQDKLKNLYRMATEVDAVVGAVIEELKEQGVYNNTLLIFTTDNGNLHGEHGLAEKWYPWEESIRVPLVVQDPRMPQNQRGTINREFTLSIDLAPTILQAAQIPIPSYMQGRDFSYLYRAPLETAKTWRQDFFYEWTQGENVNAVGHNAYNHIPAVFALIRRDWKYFYWPQTKYEQLFHIEKDLYEEWDIINSTAQTTVEALHIMKARYAFLKNWSQSGKPV